MQTFCRTLTRRNIFGSSTLGLNQHILRQCNKSHHNFIFAYTCRRGKKDIMSMHVCLCAVFYQPKWTVQNDLHKLPTIWHQVKNTPFEKVWGLFVMIMVYRNHLCVYQKLHICIFSAHKNNIIWRYNADSRYISSNVRLNTIRTFGLSTRILNFV